MEMEYRDPARRGKIIVIVGIALAFVAGLSALLVVQRAAEQASHADLTLVPVVVAARDLPARAALETTDLVLRQVPMDGTNASGVYSDPIALSGLVTSVPILSGQPIFANMLAGQSQGVEFAILGPDETVSPDSPIWRAVAITVPDDRAAGGLIETGQTVDVIVTLLITLPDSLVDEGLYTSDRSTKLVYQDMLVLAKTATSYVVKAPIDVAEEISHFQASGLAGFSLLARPLQDLRDVDASSLGTTTSRIITRYGLILPEVFPPGSGPLPTPPPTPVPSPAPVESPLPSAVGSPVPSP